MAITETTSLNAILNETGKVYLSVDGYGTLSQTGSVEVLKKLDATVRKAYLVGSGTNISSSVIGTTATLNGTNVNWDRIESTPWGGGNSFYSYLADVTSVLKPTIDSAAPGTLNIALDEGNETYSYEGLALAVLFDDPNQTTDNNVILYFGGLPTTGATTTINFSSPVDLNQVGAATLGLGIGFSYAAAGQTSQVSVNGQQLSLVAGNYDDGVSGPNNGSLFTVGGLGDNTNNPPLLSTDPATDDELYNLLPFINNGDSSLTLNTINPSNDDHIFFAHLTLEGLQSTTISSVISFSSSAYQLQEDGSAISSVTLTRSGSVIGEVSVTLTPTDGTAVAGNDYDGTPIVVNFADGQARATVTIPIIDNTVYQGDKTINLALSDPTNGATLGSQFTSLLTIVENDPQPIEKYTFTYFYGNGDSYSGYGFAPSGTYSVGQLPDFYDNETGNQGYYVIDSVEAGETGANSYVYVTSYTDADTGFGTTTNIEDANWGDGIHGYSGLGSEQGYAFNATPWTGDYYFSSYSEADLAAVLQVRVNLLADNDGTPGEILANDQVGLNRSFFVQIQVGDFRGNAAGVVGLNLDFGWDGLILESINFDPTLAINPDFSYLQDGTLAYDGLIDDLSGGSLPEFELGQAIGVNQLDTFALLHFRADSLSNSTTYFTTTVNDASFADDYAFNAASLDVEQQPIQVISPYSKYNFTYYYGNGDSYSGYVYAVEGTYTVGQTLEGYSNETGNLGYYEIESIASVTLDSSYNNRVYITSYTDADTGFGTTTNISYGFGGSGLGSEYGYAYDTNGNSSDPYFSNSAEADILGNQKYNFTYYYGNGDSYSGYGYAAIGTYTVGQTFTGNTNETGFSGYYVIDSVELGNTNAGYNGYVYLTSYFDGDTGYGTTTNIGDANWGDGIHGYSGLGSEYGYAYDTNGNGSDSYFGGGYWEADILNQKYTFTYTYGNGDSYSGYGYALAGTYTAGQTLEGYSNETGNSGYYTINSVEAGTTSSSEHNRVYVTSYTDADTGFGTTTNIGEDWWTADGIHGYSGLGSESGYAYDANGNSSDPLFSNSTEADIYSIPTLSIRPTDAIKAEGSSGLTYFTFTVNRVGSLFYSSSVDWYVMGSGANPASFDDFGSGSYPQGTLEFDPGEDTATIIVEVNGDITSEMDEFFSVTLSNPVGAILDTSSVGSSIISSVSGGYGVTTNYYSLANGGGRFVMNYEMYGIPDQAEIFINGSLAASTGGFVSYSGSLNLDTYALQSGDIVRVVMTGADLGTAWDYTVQYNGGVGTLNYIADGVILNDDIPSLAITDNSGNANDSSIKFTTRFPLRQNYAESDFVRPNFADTTKYFDITNTGTGILQVFDIVSNVTGVNTNFVDDLFINPGESQRIQLTYDPSAARENFSVADGLVLSTNVPNFTQYAIALSGKSTFNSDINYDGRVGTGDLGPLNNARRNFNNGIYDGTADINGDGLINIDDLTIFNSERGLALALV